MEQDGLRDSAHLTRALAHTSDTYDQIANLCEDQPRLDFEPMGDLLHDYRGLLASFPDITTVHKGALQKRRELERSAAEGKTEQSIVSRAQQRTDVVSYTLLAEMSYFHQQRIQDYNRAIKIFLQEQITYYQKVSTNLALFFFLIFSFIFFSFRLSITFSRRCLSTVTKRAPDFQRIIIFSLFYFIFKFRAFPFYFGA